MEKHDKIKTPEFDEGWMHPDVSGVIRLMPGQIRAYREFQAKRYGGVNDEDGLYFKGHKVEQREFKPTFEDLRDSVLNDENLQIPDTVPKDIEKRGDSPGLLIPEF
jgi:hypothetical protein